MFNLSKSSTQSSTSTPSISANPINPNARIASIAPIPIGFPISPIFGGPFNLDRIPYGRFCRYACVIFHRELTRERNEILMRMQLLYQQQEYYTRCINSILFSRALVVLGLPAHFADKEELEEADEGDGNGTDLPNKRARVDEEKDDNLATATVEGCGCGCGGAEECESDLEVEDMKIMRAWLEVRVRT